MRRISFAFEKHTSIDHRVFDEETVSGSMCRRSTPGVRRSALNPLLNRKVAHNDNDA